MADLFTLDVGQGNFAVLRGQSEVIVIDTHLPPESGRRAELAKSSLSKIFNGRSLKGVILTGFGEEHAGPRGLAMVLEKYEPEWAMYPKHGKPSTEAEAVLGLIASGSAGKAGTPEMVPVCLDRWNAPPALGHLSREFSFRAFSPCAGDGANHAGESLVLKITERSTERGVLVTGDTGARQLEEICAKYPNELVVDALQAPQHGSMDGITGRAYHAIFPHTVLVSAGIENQFGHPHAEARRLFRSGSKCYCTSYEGSVVTVMERASISTCRYSG